MDIQRIDAAKALELIESADQESVQIVDIRDDASFAASHIAGASHLHGANMQEFVNNADPELPVLVYCYHGFASMAAAAFLQEQGFREVYSLDGGYEGWLVLENEKNS